MITHVNLSSPAQLPHETEPHLEDAAGLHADSSLSRLFRRLFARTAHAESVNIRESIRRDNLRAIFNDPHWVRGEHMDDFERARRRRHVVTVDR